MDGVILFADDMVFRDHTPENRLFIELSKEHPVLPVNTLELANRAIKSIGTFSAMILDWEFREDFGDGAEHVRNPNALLDDSHFYSLVYVFSNRQIPETTRRRLKRRFGSRIIFKRKSATRNEKRKLLQNLNKIRNDMQAWQETNLHEIIPRNWGISINQSIQHIFSKLSAADPNWIIELCESAGDAVNQEIVVISLLQSLLFEKIITDQNLIQSIQDLKANPPANLTNKGISELFQKIYYSDLRNIDLAISPIMTGDVFAFKNEPGTFGIVITPECDIRKVIDNEDHKFQVLRFRRNDFREYAKRAFGWQANVKSTVNKKQKDKIHTWFNQTEESKHFLPSFPFRPGIANVPAIIDFTNPVGHYQYSQLRVKRRICKLNAPFIQQLRQRYLSYIGRIGVPTIPSALTAINIEGIV
jgi:hypothetical protein